MIRGSFVSGATLIAAGLTGCASPAVRISTSLQRYGVDSAKSACTGARLQQTLTLSQFRQLGRAAGELDRTSAQPLQPDDFFRAAEKIDHLKVPVEVAKAALSCGLLASGS